MQLFDTHVHINFDVFQSDLEAVRERWQACGVAKLVHSCVCPEEFESLRALSNRFPEVFCAVGLHPLEVSRYLGNVSNSSHQGCDCLQESLFSICRSEEKVVAIGETGLDFYKAEDRSAQVAAFEAQLAIASELDLPVIIHCRDAARETSAILESFARDREIRGVMHCWSGSPADTKPFLDLGFYISFSGIVTFKNARTVRESAQMVPLQRLLVETDCPFLAPVPMRGKRNEPAYVRHVAQKIAELRQLPLETLAETTARNACELFRLRLDG